jgi:cobalt-zinc-cadmium efflux system protein
MPAASAHVLVQPRQDCHAVRADLEDLFAREYGITHLTLQVDHLPDPVSQAAEDSPGRPGGPDREPETDDHHRADEVGRSHCEDSHGPAYRPASDG